MRPGRRRRRRSCPSWCRRRWKPPRNRRGRAARAAAQAARRAVDEERAMKFHAWVPAVVVGLLLLLGSVFVVSEGQSALVLNLGKVVRSDIGPGLHFKLPLIESARVFDRRLQV